MQKIKFCFTSEKAKELYNGKPPQFETPFANGFDLRAVEVDNKYDIYGIIHNCEKDYDDDKMPEITGWKLFSGRKTLIKTGIRIELPLPNKVGEIMGIDIRSRSGLASKHGLRVFQGVGTIDNDYRGELGVIFENAGHEPYEIKIGDKIAQGVFNPLKQVEFEEISQEEFEKTCCNTKRGSGGFGSTGK
jgi:dUTP pyrophosphatase